eukprot:g20773.t1
MASTNFDHLKPLSPQLHRLGALAEQFFSQDANTSLIKSRQFAELMVKEVAAMSGRYDPALRETTNDLLRRLTTQQILPREVSDVFHAVRRQGNQATHEFTGTPGEALSALKFCRSLGVWFRRTYGRDPNFKPGPFVPPKDPKEADESLKADLEKLRAEVRATEAELAAAQVESEEHRKAREAMEELIRQASEESAIWEQSALEQEATAAELAKQLEDLQKKAEAEPEQLQLELKQAGREAASRLELDEADTRLLIDVQLMNMGWEADTKELKHARGTRPEKGRNLAIAEWPTGTGPVDYALFVGEVCVGVIEAKREAADVPGVLAQAQRYARGIDLKPENLVQGSPWKQGLDEPYRVPFAFATNGRPFIRQWKTKSGIWHCDLRRSSNQPDALPQWFSPKDLMDKLETDVDAAAEGLAYEKFGKGKLRPYQEEAIEAIEDAIQHGQRDVLISMATGTGKTRTSIALMYRLLKHSRFRRILFLVDRKALGKQTEDALETTELEGLLNFAQIYGVAGLDQKMPEPEQRVQVATVQSLIARILNEEDVGKRPTPGTYDCIIVDEAHRGYTLDADLRESDLGFRRLEDYQSAYRQVLDYFDAVKIALTATPALHTREIFGHPVFHYGYRQAVIEGYLIDHLPPRRITTALAEAGIHFEGGEEVEIIDRKTGQVDLFELPDDVDLDYDLATFNRKVYSENFNRIVCQALAREIPPDSPGKTLIFAARDDHADDVVRLLTEELQDEYGSSAVPQGMVQKITGQTDNGNTQPHILKFKNDSLPKYVVTVDLLTTGIDVPTICNLVFLRRVRSRILYDQMIGRATRLCPEIRKEHFRIFDAVDLYAELQEMSDMRPVVVKPDVPLCQLVTDLFQAPDEEDRNWVAGQVVVKMRNLAGRVDEETRESFENHTGQSPEVAVQVLSQKSGEELVEWLRTYPRAVELLERKPVRSVRTSDGVVISNHEDELIRIEEIFGKNTRPEDYIEGFERYVRENMNKIPALVAVTQKPRDLTRKELSELAKILDEQHFSEPMLRAAYGKARNADIAAHIIGFVRQAALGDPLVPYAARVDAAILKIENSRDWSKRQKDWLRRIGRALRDRPVADPSLLEQGSFADHGGFQRISREFDGNLAGEYGSDMNANAIVQKLWRLCAVLRKDGITYQQYVTELTYLLFLKMMAERGREEGNIPEAYRWAQLVRTEPLQKLRVYREALTKLGDPEAGHPRMVQAIFDNASTFIREPQNLTTLVTAIDELDWFSDERDQFGDLYEGLLQKNAEETKRGAGQYFTPRVLIEVLVRLMQPKPGEVIQDPASGTGGFLIASDRFMRARTDNYFALGEKEQEFQKHQAFHGMENPGGRAAIVVPDNVLFEDGRGKALRQMLMDWCNLHTILRLPTGIFYAQGVKTNVIFLTRGRTESGNTDEIWVYDLRAQMPKFGKTNQLTDDHFKDFETAFGSDPYGKERGDDQGEDGRWRCFTREEITARGDNLDITWLREAEDEAEEGLTEPEDIAAAILGHLQAAMVEIEALSVELEETVQGEASEAAE